MDGRTISAAVSTLAVSLVLAACGPGTVYPPGSPGGSSEPTGGASGSPLIEHATGATDIVFRFEQGGGFVPLGFFATQAPQFTLYGDRTVLFRDATATPSLNDTVGALQPYVIATLTEGEVQAFLSFALTDSGLATAGPSYSPGNVADAPTSIFTVHAGGVDKTVSVDALGFENPQSPDTAILASLATLGARIDSFATVIDGETLWLPDRWRGVLTPDAVDPTMAWPWSDLAPADFVQPTDPAAPQFPIHTLTPAHVAALGLTGIEGGFAALSMSGPDGRPYSLALRPILPDETR